MSSNRKLLTLFVLLSSSLFGATATPVTVTSTTVAGNTVTVNATAHGLAVNQGFCNHTATTPYCGVVVTAAANSFTFTQSGATACASSCGAVVPAKKVIILETPTINGQGVNARYLCWNSTQQPLAITGAVSAWKGAAAEENSAIAAGYFIETSRPLFVTNGLTLAQAQSLMVADCNNLQTNLAAGVQPGQFYGDFFDTGWLQ